jgi:hypothetical protein
MIAATTYDQQEVNMTNIISSSRYARYSIALAVLAMCLMLAPWNATFANAQEAGQTTAGKLVKPAAAALPPVVVPLQLGEIITVPPNVPVGLLDTNGTSVQLRGVANLGAAPFVVQCWTGGVTGVLTPGTVWGLLPVNSSYAGITCPAVSDTIVMTCGGPGNCTVFWVP